MCYSDNIQLNLAYAYEMIDIETFVDFPTMMRQVVKDGEKGYIDMSVITELRNVVGRVRAEKQSPPRTMVRFQGHKPHAPLLVPVVPQQTWLPSIVHVSVANRVFCVGLACRITQYVVYDRQVIANRVYLHERDQGKRPVNPWFVMEWVQDQIESFLQNVSSISFPDVYNSWWMTATRIGVSKPCSALCNEYCLFN